MQLQFYLIQTYKRVDAFDSLLAPQSSFFSLSNDLGLILGPPSCFESRESDPGSWQTMIHTWSLCDLLYLAVVT